ncbi:hypothetical protein MHU86_13743 [Fragilaria crotonensis]|nr:hypothetical protein MHU86_13743 [Fragilaria crotonensis]
MLNKAISSCGGAVLDDFTDSNQTGRFRRCSFGQDPFGNPKRNIWGYYITTPGGLVQRLPDEVVDLTNEIADQSTAKRRAIAQVETADKAKKPKHGPASSKIVVQTYWDSPEAKKLFLGNSSDDRDVLDVLHKWIKRLQQVNRTADGWKDLIDKHDKDNLCSPYDIFLIRQRCCILCLAYTYAIEEMNSARWIADCCVRAVLDCNRMGIEAAATNERTVAGWNALLRANRERFPVPDPKTHKQNKPLPILLEYFREDITLPWIEYCVTNLADLTVEQARNELITTIIPNAIANERTATTNETNEDEDEEDAEATKESLLNGYLDCPISFTTAWQWLRCLGFHYDNRKKSFFVDGHERPNVVFHRNEFCTNYLTKLEPRTHRWIQVTKETVEKWKSEKKISYDDDARRGYTYQDQQTGEEMVEFHVNDFDMLHDVVAEEMGFGTFGGNLSVRKPPEEKPLMLFGQDKSVYSQYHLKSKQWVGPLGQRALLPKTDGLSLMISAIQSRETGFGVHISQLEEINEVRRGTNYVDVDAAMAIHGQCGIRDLKESPFVVSFELGANNEGYWTYNHMSIQFEDCVDCVKVLYPQFDFVSLFDHSQGHAKKLTNGLDAYSMNRGYGGSTAENA